MERIKCDRQAEIDMETDTQERKYTAITFMIKSSVQFSSNLDCPVRENRAGGRVLTDVWMYSCSQCFDHSTTVTSFTIIYSCAWDDMDPLRKLGHRDATRLTRSQWGEESEHRWTCKDPYCTHTHTLWLAELVEDHNVMRVVEVFSQCVDVLTSQPVGHEDRGPVSVCPVDSILKHRESLP